MNSPTPVILMWHMHQPQYKDPLSGEYLLPWTYLHAVKDYYDMAAIIDEVDGARAVVNFVPSLLDQLEDYAAGTAIDQFLVHGRKDPALMSDAERLFIINNFFAANRQRLIETNIRYLELFRMAGDISDSDSPRLLRQFRYQDILDLQVCFFLAWTGEAARRRFPELQDLLAKERGYTMQDKATLFNIHNRILKSIIPLYRKLHLEGKIELTVTPYFHPILPLLCDTRIAEVAMPRVQLPDVRLRIPQDARSQILCGIAAFERIFGFKPEGCWPSEGSVSDQTLSILTECGIKWAATDEAVLAASIGGLGPHREKLYHRYSFGSDSGDIAMIFRDHTLSDLVGFTYSQWEENLAAADFIDRLRQIAAGQHTPSIIPVILDGENAWEYYPANGYNFLKEVYTLLATAREVRASTVAETRQKSVRHRLQHIHPGSWINGNYGIWIGHPEENVAWQLLAKTREAAIIRSPEVAATLAAHVTDLDAIEDATVASVCRDLFAAQGSDWFWWYGDDHFSAHAGLFDLLFRRHLISVYRTLKIEVPEELYQPIKKSSPAGFVKLPAGFITPEISGSVGDYFEWLAAGLFELCKQASAMHSQTSYLLRFYYGFDQQNLYFRIDGAGTLERFFLENDKMLINLTCNDEFRLAINPGTGQAPLLRRSGESWLENGSSCRFAMVKICEAAIPLSALGLQPGADILVTISHLRDGNDIGRWPNDAPMKLRYVGDEIELDSWLI